MALVDDLIARFTEEQDRANAANQQRYEQALGIYDQIAERYKEGGTFLKGVESQLKQAGTLATAKGMQNLVSSGLSGTTQVAGLQKKFEAEVGAPTRLQAQDVAQQRLSSAEREKALAIERRQDVGPDYGTIAGLAKSIGSGQASSGSSPTVSYQSVKQPLWSTGARARYSASRVTRKKGSTFTSR